MESLRQSVNQALYLGLHDLEAHLAASYPPGSFYQAHLDRFRDSDLRTLTVRALSQPARLAGRGRRPPALLGLSTGRATACCSRPAGGTLVTFLSDRFWHAVELSRRTRLSVTGWFRRRPAL